MNWDRARRKLRKAAKGGSIDLKLETRKNDLPLRMPSHKPKHPMKTGASQSQSN
jgi:hypothetical protein